MRIILLCAGFGTRMYPLTKNYPKPLLEVRGKPVVDYLIDQFVHFNGLELIQVVTNALFFEQFEGWGDGWRQMLNEHNINIEIYNDGVVANEFRLGAVGDLEFVLEQKSQILGKSLVAAGDMIFSFDLAEIWNKFLSSNRSYVIALNEPDSEKLKSGAVLDLTDDGKVISYVEKPEEPTSNWYCPPLYFMQPNSFGHLSIFRKEYPKLDAPGYFFAYLSRQTDLYAYKVEGEQIDIGSMEDYLQAEKILTAWEAEGKPNFQDAHCA
ncbi:sugar phosphate nucleotidyltransferase [Chloroflexota bacterium]